MTQAPAPGKSPPAPPDPATARHRTSQNHPPQAPTQPAATLWRAIDRQNLPGPARDLLRLLAFHERSRDRPRRLRLETLAAYTGQARRTLQRSLARLVAARLVTCTPTGRAPELRLQWSALTGGAPEAPAGVRINGARWAAINALDLPATQKAVLRLVALDGRPTTRQRLAERTGYSLRTIGPALAGLAAAGLVTCEPAGGRQIRILANLPLAASNHAPEDPPPAPANPANTAHQTPAKRANTAQPPANTAHQVRKSGAEVGKYGAPTFPTFPMIPPNPSPAAPDDSATWAAATAALSQAGVRLATAAASNARHRGETAAAVIAAAARATNSPRYGPGALVAWCKSGRWPAGPAAPIHQRREYRQQQAQAAASRNQARREARDAARLETAYGRALDALTPAQRLALLPIEDRDSAARWPLLFRADQLEALQRQHHRHLKPTEDRTA